MSIIMPRRELLQGLNLAITDGAVVLISTPFAGSGQQLVIDGERDHNPQTSVIGAANPLMPHLLMGDGREHGPIAKLLQGIGVVALPMRVVALVVQTAITNCR
jgi:hypothetical protein